MSRVSKSLFIAVWLVVLITPPTLGSGTRTAHHRVSSSVSPLSPRSIHSIPFDGEKTRVQPLSPASMASIWHTYRFAPKGKFESTSDYIARVNTHMTSQYWAVEIPGDADQAENCSEMKFTYNADTEMFVLSVDDITFPDDDLMQVECLGGSLGIYMGVSAFGIKTRFQKYLYSNFCLSAEFAAMGPSSVTLAVERAHAASMEKLIAPVVIFHASPTPEGVVSDLQRETSDATTDDPVERITDTWSIHSDQVYLALVDRATGRILALQQMLLDNK